MFVRYKVIFSKRFSSIRKKNVIKDIEKNPIVNPLNKFYNPLKKVGIDFKFKFENKF